MSIFQEKNRFSFINLRIKILDLAVDRFLIMQTATYKMSQATNFLAIKQPIKLNMGPHMINHFKWTRINLSILRMLSIVICRREENNQANFRMKLKPLQSRSLSLLKSWTQPISLDNSSLFMRVASLRCGLRTQGMRRIIVIKTNKSLVMHL